MSDVVSASADDSEDEVMTHAEARVGRLLKDKWTLDQLIGVGGMAAVYAATHRNGKRVAVKMLHAAYSADKGVRQRFLREGYVANKVEHRGAVSVDDDDVDDDGSAFLVMELLEGEPMDARMARRGNRLPVEDVLTVADQLLDVLASAHDAGVVHRDLKPENIFLTGDGVVKVLDFGIARLREMSEKANATQAGSLMGTPAFMAPEQARGRWDDVDGRTDLWAVGATMFTALTGHNVHEADTVNELLAMAITRPARSLGSVMPTLPRSVVEVIDRSLSYDQGARWADARQMRAAVLAAHQELAGGAPASHPQWTVPEGETLRIDGADPAPLSGAQRAQTTTGQGLSNTLVDSAGVSTPRRRTNRFGILVGLGAVVAAAAGAAVWILAARDEPQASSPVIAAEVPPQSPRVAPEVKAPPVEPEETVEAAPVADDLEFELVPILKPEVTSRAVRPRRAAVKRRPTASVQPNAASARPAATKPAAAKPAADPFGTRY